MGLYAEIQNLTQLSPNMTKLCHMKRNHLVNFYISPEKERKTVIFLQHYGRYPQNVAQ